MKYTSTRGNAPALSFEDTVLAGLASDGGLYLPDNVPEFSMAEINAMQKMTYPELALTVIAPFVGDSIDRDTLKSMIDEAYGSFRHAAIAPLKQLGTHTFLLELFHGPTLAFKDFALQFLGRLLEHILVKRDQNAVVIGATSGDTGSAAIAGCQGRKNMDIVILHPKGRVSDVQRRQMTTVTDKNVHNIAIEGTFDDCQDIVKALFADESFRTQHHLSAVNSINWARILAQVVYYFYAAVALGAPGRSVSFAVPTGNFGDIYAGYIASKMGLAVDQLIIGTNCNDILSRCLATGTYSMEGVVPTLSPSMDIQISSNFERLLFDLYDRDSAEIVKLMTGLRTDKKFTLSPMIHKRLKAMFAAGSVNDEETKATIAQLYKTTGELLDPHTAVGLAAGERCRTARNTPLIVLATAHPAKFPDAVHTSVGIRPALPHHMEGLMTRPERYDVMASDVAKVKDFIHANC